MKVYVIQTKMDDDFVYETCRDSWIETEAGAFTSFDEAMKKAKEIAFGHGSITRELENGYFVENGHDIGYWINASFTILVEEMELH